MPMCAYDTGRGSNLGRDDIELLFRKPTDINLDMNGFVDAELRDNSPRQHIQVLKALDNPSDGTGISVGDDP